MYDESFLPCSKTFESFCRVHSLTVTPKAASGAIDFVISVASCSCALVLIWESDARSPQLVDVILVPSKIVLVR